MLPGFETHGNKCCTIAARQTAEGDMFKKPRKMQRHEMRSPSLASPSAGARTAHVMTSSLRDDGGAELYGGLLSTRIASWRTCVVHPWVFSNSFTGIQTPICYETASFQWADHVGGQGRISLCVDSRNRNPPAQAGSQSGTRGGKPSGLLFPLFRSSKERQRSPPSHFGSACIKQAPQKVFIQNANTQGAVSIDSSKRLVCGDRSGGCVLPHRYLSLSQEIPQVCIPGHSIRISNYTVRAVISSEGFYQMCGGSPVPIEGQGHKDIVLHRRLSDMLVVKGASHKRCRDCPKSPQRPGFQDKHDEPAGALSTYGVFRAQLGLPFVSSHIDGRE
ncbi:uncharacterized protein LOC125140130 [Tachysurus fulvidraco]|uniref:uncharacterized protein LOC125140130 n=1 Tax=Tachysurus fulvidraco TaxID=1234273 RepID=UPI001FEF82F6|nr:uncharacterized protein LOC125140130 [Tachysurus fulvidraco]